METQPDKGLTTAQAAERLGVAPETIIDMLRRHQLRGNKIGHQWRVSDNSVSEFLNGGVKVETKVIVRRIPAARLPAVPMRVRTKV